MKFLTIGGLTLDDIVAHDGRFYPGTPGGNSLYSAAGARLWGADVAMLAFAGQDFPAEALRRLEASGIDLSMLARLDGPSIHLWVLYEPDGRRQIFYEHRSSPLEMLDGLVRQAGPQLAARLGPGAAIHVAALPVALQQPILQTVRPLAAQLTLDSIEARGTVGGDLPSYWRAGLFDGVTAFLPSRDEFALIQGDRPAEEAVFALAGTALRYVVVKDGEHGARLFDIARRTQQHVPAFPAHVVDPTGAGDAFCGGFMAGLAQTGDALEAMLRGTVSASFVVEGLGALPLLDVRREQAEARLERLRSMMTAREG